MTQLLASKDFLKPVMEDRRPAGSIRHQYGEVQPKLTAVLWFIDLAQLFCMQLPAPSYP